jgi:hypothetical protein
MRITSKGTAMAAFALLAIANFAQVAYAGCSNQTLQGDYAFRVSGEVFTPAGVVNRDGVAMTHFNGQGGLSQVDWWWPTECQSPVRRTSTDSTTMKQDSTR